MTVRPARTRAKRRVAQSGSRTEHTEQATLMLLYVVAGQLRLCLGWVGWAFLDRTEEIDINDIGGSKRMGTVTPSTLRRQSWNKGD